nr:MAG TPA: hypothetical protein [Caudoviricetes sp.]DAZ12081.1 MAG TPA: hypothetical protein [Caudoviricetes sp.]
MINNNTLYLKPIGLYLSYIRIRARRKYIMPL